MSLDILETCLGQVPPPPTTGTLTVIKNVDCQANMNFCEQNPNSTFKFHYHYKWYQSNSKRVSWRIYPGTEVQIGLGQYNVTEEGLETPTPHVCSREGFEAGSSFGTNLFICTNFSDGCEGDITPGSTQTCEITNVLVFCDPNAMTSNYRGFQCTKRYSI